MKAHPNPPRLIHDPQVGPTLQKAAQHTWTPERMERSRSVIAEAAAAASPTATGSGAAGPGAPAIGRSLAKVLLPLMLGGAVAVALLRDPTPPAESAPAAPPGSTTPVPHDEGEPPREPGAELGVKSHDGEATSGPERLPQRPASSAAPKGEPKSTWSEQLALFAAARKAAETGRYDEALANLDALRTRYPDTPLGLDARMAQVEYLAAAGRSEAALAAIDDLLSERSLLGKKAQLLRLKGDLLLRRDDCPGARAAYQRALGLGLTGAEAEAAQQGLKKCSPP